MTCVDFERADVLLCVCRTRDDLTGCAIVIWKGCEFERTPRRAPLAVAPPPGGGRQRRVSAIRTDTPSPLLHKVLFAGAARAFFPFVFCAALWIIVTSPMRCVTINENDPCKISRAEIWFPHKTYEPHHKRLKRNLDLMHNFLSVYKNADYLISRGECYLSRLLRAA